MYLVNLSDTPYKNAWKNYASVKRLAGTWDLTSGLEQINAVDAPESSNEIYFLTEEDATAFVLRYS